jgi:cell division protein FtsB
MVIRTRSRTILTALGLSLLGGLLIVYFGMHAQSGRRGIKATEDLAIEMRALTEELAKLKSERSDWERRVVLLRPESLDPDMLDERARAMLDYVHPRDLVLSGRRAAEPKFGPVAAAR